MARLTSFSDFLNEKLGVNDDVKKLTNIIFDAVVNNMEVLKSEKTLTFHNLLQNNYKNLIIFNDTLIFKLSDNFHAGITKQENKNNIIVSLEIIFNVDIENINRLKYFINNELNHVIENFYSVELSKEWDIYQKFKEHQILFNGYSTWIDISNIFYDVMSQELRSRTSSTYETLKSLNSKDVDLLRKTILLSPEYKKLNDIVKIDPKQILEVLKMEYPDQYVDILSNFMKTVFNIDYSEDNFIKLLENLKQKVKKQIKKLLRLVSAILIEKNGYIEEYYENNINYCEYIEKKLKK